MKRSLIDLGRAKIPQDEAEFLWLVTLTSHFAIFSLYGRILFGTPVPSVVLAIELGAVGLLMWMLLRNRNPEEQLVIQWIMNGVAVCIAAGGIAFGVALRKIGLHMIGTGVMIHCIVGAGFGLLGYLLAQMQHRMTQLELHPGSLQLRWLPPGRSNPYPQLDMPPWLAHGTAGAAAAAQDEPQQQREYLDSDGNVQEALDWQEEADSGEVVEMGLLDKCMKEASSGMLNQLDMFDEWDDWTE